MTQTLRQKKPDPDIPSYSCHTPPVKPLLNQRQCQKHLTWAKEKKNWSVQSPLFRLKYILYFIWKSRSQSPEEVWRDTQSKLLGVQCEVLLVSDDLRSNVIFWC